MTTGNTLTTISIAHSRAVTPLQGASSSRQDRRSIVHGAPPSCVVGLHAHQLVVQIGCLLETLTVLNRDVVGRWSDLPLIQERHIINILMDLWHQIQL